MFSLSKEKDNNWDGLLILSWHPANKVCRPLGVVEAMVGLRTLSPGSAGGGGDMDALARSSPLLSVPGSHPPHLCAIHVCSDFAF